MSQYEVKLTTSLSPSPEFCKYRIFDSINRRKDIFNQSLELDRVSVSKRRVQNHSCVIPKTDQQNPLAVNENKILYTLTAFDYANQSSKHKNTDKFRKIIIRSGENYQSPETNPIVTKIACTEDEIKSHRSFKPNFYKKKTKTLKKNTLDEISENDTDFQATREQNLSYFKGFFLAKKQNKRLESRANDREKSWHAFKSHQNAIHDQTYRKLAEETIKLKNKNLIYKLREKKEFNNYLNSVINPASYENCVTKLTYASTSIHLQIYKIISSRNTIPLDPDWSISNNSQVDLIPNKFNADEDNINFFFCCLTSYFYSSYRLDKVAHGLPFDWTNKGIDVFMNNLSMVLRESRGVIVGFYSLDVDNRVCLAAYRFYSPNLSEEYVVYKIINLFVVNIVENIKFINEIPINSHQKKILEELRPGDPVESKEKLYFFEKIGNNQLQLELDQIVHTKRYYDLYREHGTTRYTAYFKDAKFDEKRRNFLKFERPQKAKRSSAFNVTTSSNKMIQRSRIRIRPEPIVTLIPQKLKSVSNVKDFVNDLRN